MKYDNYVARLAQQVRAALDLISAGYAFDYGPEFEIAFCEILSRALPDRIGVCRGFVVDADGNKAGDDIIIFDRTRFPTLRLMQAGDFSRKESIPIEAVYAYIEAKHTLHIRGSGPQSLDRALQQIAAVRTLIAKREAVRPGQAMPLLNLNDCGIPVISPAYLPAIANPLFTMIIARHVRRSKKGQPLTDPEIVRKLLNSKSWPSAADLAVLGENIAVVPVLRLAPGSVEYKSVFLPKQYEINARRVDGLGFGIAIASLGAAIDWIQLGRLHWHAIIAEALGTIPKPKD